MPTHTSRIVALATIGVTGAACLGPFAITPARAQPATQAPNVPTIQSPLDDAGALTPDALRAFGGTKGVSRPSQDAIMGFSLPTSVKEITRRSGERVRKDDIIVRGDDGEDAALLKLQKSRVERPLPVERAKAAMDLAEVEYNRLKEVQARGGSGTQEVERARLSFEVSRIDHLTAENAFEQELIQLERMQARVDRYRLLAPFDGIVDTVNIDVGQVLEANEKIVRVVDVDPLWIDVAPSTEDPSTLALKPGDKAWLLCDVAGDARVGVGRVIEVAPTADPASRTRRVRVELPNPDGAGRLLAGEPMWVRFTPPKEGWNAQASADAEHALARGPRTP
jgi:RND family efflux transporter MFP subunit